MCTIGPDRQPGQQLAGQLSSKDQESDARAWGRMPGLVSHLFQICIFIYLYVSVYIFALACFHLVSLVLVDTTCVRSGQIWADLVVDLVRSCEALSDLVVDLPEADL